MRDDRDDQRAMARSNTDEAAASVDYDWDLATDTITWGGNIGAVLGHDAANRLSTGTDFADHLAAASPSSRYEAIIASGGCDTGGGVPYAAIYGLLPAKRSGGPITWVEDTGRWFADACDRPSRAHGRIRIVTERYEAEQQLAAAGLDADTGTLGPAQFVDHVTRQLNAADARSATFAVLIIAIDTLDPTESADDAAIVATLSHLRVEMRGHESVARHGARCFAVLLETCDAGQAERAGQRFIARVAEPLSGVPAMRARVGAVLAPSQGQTAQALIRCAEAALAVARRPASPPYVRHEFAPGDVHATVGDDRSDAIVAAINQGRVALVLQPIVCARTRQPIGHDARVQIVRTDGSPMLAEAILPVALESGFGPILDRRVLDLAFAMLTRNRSLKLSIVVALASLTGSALIDHLSVASKLRPDAARRLTIGITEADAIADLAAARRALAAIKPLGVRIAVNDVGARTASYHAFRLLPIDVLTIEDAVVSAAGRPFIGGLIALARDLDASVVARQVQDEATADLLAGWGVTCLQGDLFGRFEVPVGAPIAATG